MSRASRESKEGSKNYNTRKSMRLKNYRKWCMRLSKYNRRAKRNLRNFRSRPIIHLQFKRRYK